MVIFQNRRESHFRTALLKNSLSECIDLTDRFITSNSIKKDNFHNNLDSLKDLIPPGKVQITIIDLDGKVLYDNTINDYSQLKNYKERPEIKKAMEHKSGDYIRVSALGKGEFYYYAKTYNDYIIRAGIPFDKEIRDFIRSEDFYIPFFLLLFVIFGLILSYISGNISDNLSNLKDFLLRVRRGECLDQKLAFSNDEIGAISRNVNDLYEDFSRNTSELLLEKEKLINHLYIQKEGLAFFTQYKREILSNFHFLNYLNKISEETILSVEDLFQVRELQHLNDFIDSVLSESVSFNTDNPPQKCFKIKVKENVFPICVIFFADKSFEIHIKKAEKVNSKQLSQAEIK
jgi:methyl-accepting chemotaxis protein